jgi:hypothetical protein
MQPIGRAHRGRRHPSGLDAVLTHQVEYFAARAQQIIGDDPPVTPPPYCLGAHDCDAPFTGQRLKLGKPRAEVRRQRVIRIIVEAPVAPEPFTPGGTACDRFLSPPSSAIRVWPI